MSAASMHRLAVDPALAFCRQALERMNVRPEDAHATAEVLVAADLRGIASHGVAHLRRYVDAIRDGTIIARPQEHIVVETPVTATIDAGAGLGPPVSTRAMSLAIDKACKSGVGFVAVRNSNHHGIAGYYAMMALPHDCIGITMTNASPRVVPTFCTNALLGTNPIAVAVPAGDGRRFVLDMATSVVAQGKLEIADQLDQPIPLGWALDRNGVPTTDSHQTLQDLKSRAGAGLLPLGGHGDLLGGYKGYGLGLWVEIFSALLSGAAFSTLTYPKSPTGSPLPANLGHFFGAWRIDCFRPVEDFRAGMDDLLALLRDAPRADGCERIFIHGEKEEEATIENRRRGIPVNDRVWQELFALGKELGVEFPMK